VGVVVHDDDAVLLQDLKAPLGEPEAPQRPEHRGEVEPDEVADEQGGQGVPHVVDAGGVQLQLPDRLAAEDEPGAGAQAVLLDVIGDEVRPGRPRAPVGDAEGERPFGVAGERGQRVKAATSAASLL